MFSYNLLIPAAEVLERLSNVSNSHNKLCNLALICW